MKTNKITVVPRLRFPEFQDGGDWSFNSLERLANVVRGGSPRPIDKYMTENKNGLNWLKIGDVDKESKYITTTQDKVICSALSKTRVVKPDDLIMSNSMSFGRPYILKIESCIHDGWIAITEIDKNIDTNFLYYLILSNSSQRYFLDNAAGGGIRNLNIKIIEGLKVPFCTLPEQQKIADCLSSLDDLINAENEQLDALQEYKAGLLQQLFPAEGETMPKLRFAEFKDDGDWEEVKLVDLAKFRRGSFPQPYGLAEWYDDKNGMPFVQVYDVSDNLKLKSTTKRKISKLATEQSVFIPEGTLIITIQGSIGRVAITQYDAYIDRTLLIFQEFFKPVDKFFLAYVLQLLFYIEKQKAPGGIIKTITKEALSSFKINLPDIGEQQKIADCLSSLDNLIQAKDKQIDALKDHKQGLMQQLFPMMDGE